MPPGKHSIAVGRSARHQGALRDTIRILMPGPEVLIVALHREPLDGTVVETCLKHGHGALNIDGCRIETCDLLQNHYRSGVTQHVFGCTAQTTHQTKGQQIGRWPTNVLLVHGPGCRHVGKKTVKGSNQPGSAKDATIVRTLDHKSIFQQLHAKDRTAPYYTDPEQYGTETVDAWDCQPNCPVRLIDEMSGDRPGMPLTSRRSGKSPKGYGLGIFPDGASMSPGYGDEGAASRFYPQFKDLDEALAWIYRLIGEV